MERQLKDLILEWNGSNEGAELHATVARLYPICRSITGEGLRQSLRMLQEYVPLTLHEVRTGTQVFDWSVPKEWNIREAWIKNAAGEKVVDFANSSLHVVNYSVPVSRIMTRTELRNHVHTLPESPDWIPYRTSYYKESWGFCLSERQWESLQDQEYEVCIDSTLADGHLTFAEFKIPGAIDEEVIISAHACHPSLCNDNLSGITVAAKVAQCLSRVSLRYSYRFLWIPATIGSITWLAQNESVLPMIRHGLVLSCIGDPGRFTYKRSRRGAADVDRAVECVLRRSGKKFDVLNFSPEGYDERQYCSPGINLPVGCFMRTPNGKYRQYHTSGDNLDFVTPAALAESAHTLLNVIEVLERNHRYVNLNPKCEPQLGRRGLYRLMGGQRNTGFEQAVLWVLNFSDGEHSLLDIAERSALGFGELAEAADVLVDHGLLRRIDN